MDVRSRFSALLAIYEKKKADKATYAVMMEAHKGMVRERERYAKARPAIASCSTQRRTSRKVRLPALLKQAAR